MTKVPSLLELARDLSEGRETSASLVAGALEGECPGAVEQRLDRARDEARTSDERRARGRPLSPLDGLPFAVKANIDVAGVVTTNGTGLGGTPAVEDAEVVARLRGLGMVPVLITTMAEAAVGAVTDNPHTGPCPNPRDPSRHAGGSSGGSAAVVAAGLVPFALGSDTMGSVRIPAAYTGISGYKPSRGHVSVRGLVPLGGPLDTIGFLAPRPGDLLAVHDALTGGRLGDRPGGRSGNRSGKRSGDVRVGVPAVGDHADPEARAMVDTAVTLIEGLGCQVLRDTGPAVDPQALRRAGLLLCELVLLDVYAEEYACGHPGLSPGLRRLLDYAARSPATTVLEAATRVDLVRRGTELRSQLEDLDVLLLPTTPGPVPLLGDDPSGAADLTAWVNMAGLPGVVLGEGWPERFAADRPGLQLVGRAHQDRDLLAFAHRLDAPGPGGVS